MVGAQQPAHAQHIVAEFVWRFAFDRPALPALALSVNPSCVTAIGKAYGFDRIFSRQTMVTLCSNFLGSHCAGERYSVTVTAGNTTATFNVTTHSVSNATTVTISGTKGTTQTASLTVIP